LRKIKTHLRDKIQLSTRTGQIRFKGHNKSTGYVTVAVLAVGSGGGDVTQNAATTCYRDADDSTVDDRLRFRPRLGLGLRFGGLRRVDTANGSTWDNTS